MGEYKGRSPDAFNKLCHGVGLAGAGDAEERLFRETEEDTVSEFLYRFGLVSRGFIFRNDLNVFNKSTSPEKPALRKRDKVILRNYDIVVKRNADIAERIANSSRCL